MDYGYRYASLRFKIAPSIKENVPCLTLNPRRGAEFRFQYKHRRVSALRIRLFPYYINSVCLQHAYKIAGQESHYQQE